MIRRVRIHVTNVSALCYSQWCLGYCVLWATVGNIEYIYAMLNMRYLKWFVKTKMKKAISYNKILTVVEGLLQQGVQCSRHYAAGCNCSLLALADLASFVT